MKTLIYIIPLVCTLNSFCQTNGKEHFLNEVFRTEVDKSYRHYYLIKDASAIYWHYEKSEQINKIAQHDSVRNPDKSELFENMLLFYPEISQISSTLLEELYHSANTDTVNEKWDFSQLKKARIVKDKQRHIIVGDDHKYSRLGMLSRRLFQSKEQKNIFTFSKPIFNKNGEYAIISMERYCGNLCADRCIYLFKNISGKWKEIIHFACWAS